METELFTIAIPVFNRFDFFEQAIHSALNQTVKCRIVVLDNASDHGLFSSFVSELNNPLVSYHRNEKNLGMVPNWNKCIEMAQTPWISILHDDDLLHPQFVETMLKAIKKHPEAGVLAAKTVVGQQLPDDFMERPVKDLLKIKFIKNTYFLYRNLSPFPGVAFKKSLTDHAGYFDASLHPVADLYFWYRLTCITRTAIIDEKLAFYRISNTQESYLSVVKLIEANEKFMQMVIKENKVNSLLSWLSISWACQQHIDYYNRTYPKSKIKDLPLGKILHTASITKVMNRIRDAKSFV
ncbi:MAG: glycosyltransferase [Bacteroidales bacterium]